MSTKISPDMAMRTLARLAVEAGLDTSASGDGFAEFTIPLGGGRKQTVVCRIGMIEGEAKYFVYESLAGPAKEETYERMLSINARSDFGVVGIMQYQGKDYYCVRSAQLIAECDAEELRDPVESIAAMADAIEEEILGTDEH